MKFQVLLLAFAVVIVSNIHCQAQPQLEDSDKSPVDKGHIMPKQQVRTCNCKGRRNALEQNCPCVLQRHKILSKEQMPFCRKNGTETYKKCRQMIGRNRKENKGNKGFIMPI